MHTQIINYAVLSDEGMRGVVCVDLLEKLLPVVHHESLRDFRVRRNHRCPERGGGTPYATHFTAGQERHYLFD